MKVYIGGERAQVYHGDYSPIQFYKDGVKLAGYTEIEKVGTTISGINTYNDKLLPSIDGKSEQTVTANSPSPDYPSPIRSSENFDVVSCGRDPATATTAHVTDPLRSVGDVSDSIEVSKGKVDVIRRCGIKAFDGSEAWSPNDATSGMFYCDGWVCANSIVNTPMLCTHLKYMLRYPHIAGCFGNPTRSLFFNLGDSVITYNLPAFRDFLQGQKTSGTPITVLYQLAAPTRTDITATPLGQAMLALRTYPYYTNVTTNAKVSPTVRAKIKEQIL